MGVKVGSVEYSNEPPLMKHEPGHPDAERRRLRRVPNVDMTTEFVDAIEATRAYEANIGVLEITQGHGQPNAADHRVNDALQVGRVADERARFDRTRHELHPEHNDDAAA